MSPLDNITDALWSLATSPGWAGLIALLVVAAVIDWRTHRIPNWLVVLGMGWGLAFNASTGAGLGDGLLSGTMGLACGLALLLPLYVLRLMGAGDVKLMAMVGAFLGAKPVILAALFSLVAGGAYALIYAAWQGTMGLLLTNSFLLLQTLGPQRAGSPRAGIPAPSLGRIPFAASIATGTATVLLMRELWPT